MPHIAVSLTSGSLIQSGSLVQLFVCTLDHCSVLSEEALITDYSCNQATTTWQIDGACSPPNTFKKIYP